MEALTILVMAGAVVAGLAVNAIWQRRYLAAGQGLVRSTFKSGLLGELTGFSIIGAYLVAGHLIWSLIS